MRLFKKKRKPLIKWSDITIKQHKAILDLYQREDDDLLILYGLVEIVYGVKVDDMKISEANELANTLDFIKERPKPSMVKRHYTLNGHRYNVSFNLQDILTCQYIDFQQMCNKASEMPAEFLSILLIPEGKRYNEGYDLNDVVYDIENYMKVEDCLGLSAFFFNLFRISIRRSIRKIRRMTRMAEKEGLMTNEQLEGLRKAMEALEYASGMKR